MKYNRKKHMTQKQLSDLTGLSFDSLSVRAKIDPKYPEALFVGGGYDIVYDKGKALEWITWMSHKKEQPLEIVPPRQRKPLSQQGEYKPSPTLQINLERAAEVYTHTLITPKGIGNGTERQHGYGRGQ